MGRGRRGETATRVALFVECQWLLQLDVGRRGETAMQVTLFEECQRSLQLDIAVAAATSKYL
jgi:hypothetical protein